MVNKKQFFTTVAAGLVTAFIVNWWSGRKQSGGDS